MNRYTLVAFVFIAVITTAVFADSHDFITMAVSRDPVTLDPHGPMDPSAPVLLAQIYDTLLYQDAEGMIQPYLAESWEVSSQGRTVTFHLRNDVRFSNGTLLDVDAVIFTFERLKEIALRSYIYGEMANIASFDKLSEHSVRFNLRSPSSTLLSALSFAYAAILDPGAVGDKGKSYGSSPVGSGPFMLESWDSQNSLTLVKNPFYEGHRPLDVGAPAGDIEGVRVVFAPSEASRVSAMMAGEIDVAYLSSASQVNRVTGTKNFWVMDDEVRGLVFVGFNTAKKPFDDPTIRKAVAMAINKEDILTLAIQGLGVVVHTPIPPSIFGYNPALESEVVEYDPVAAGRVIEAAGIEGTKVKILTSNFPTYRTMATILQSELEQIGLSGEIEVLDFGAMIGAASAGRYDIVLTRYTWNDPDLLRIYLGTESIGRSNRYRYSNKKLDELTSAGKREFDPSKRYEIYTEAQRIVMQDLPWIPLHMPITKVAVNNRISNIQIVNNHVILDNAVLSN